MIEIFCPKCETLILESPACRNCGWQRVALTDEVGTEVWTVDLGTKLNKPHCYPVVAGNYYCLGTEDGTLIALDAENGEIVWEHALDEGLMAHALATDGERLFVGGEDVSPIPSPGKGLLGLEAATGKRLWRAPTQAHSLSAAAVWGERVFFTATDGFLRAVDAQSGREEWRAEHPFWGPAPPIVANDLVCAGGRGNVLACYDAQDGTPRWQFTIKEQDWFAHPLRSAAGRLFALAWDNHLYVLHLNSGELLWEGVGERGRGFTTPPAVSAEHAYLGSRVHRQREGEQSPGYGLVALDVAMGEERWRHYTEKHIFTPPLVDQGQVYFGANDGTLAALNAGTGALIWNLEATSRAVTQPLLVGNVVIFGGRDGIIHAVQWQTPVAEEPSPEAYLTRGEYVEAAAAYALEGNLEKAAALYESPIGEWQKAILLYRAAGRLGRAAEILAEKERRREAAQLYEADEQHEEAARLWEALGELRRARDLFKKSGNRRAFARVLEKLGEHLDAAEVLYELEEYGAAARLFRQGGNRMREAEIYARDLNAREKAFEIWRALDEWEKEAEEYLRQDQKSKAAQILAEHHQIARAAELFEEEGELAEALQLQIRLGAWEKVALLAEQLGDYEQAAEAWEQLGEKLHAAEDYVEAAKSELGKASETRLAELYEHAARLYQDLFEEERARACQHMVKRFRRLPDIEVKVQAADRFIEYRYNILNLTVQNRGFGIARSIDIHFEGAFDVSGECCIAGVPPGRSKKLTMSVRPHKEQYGDSVPLQIVVTYQDQKGTPYQFQERTRIAVDPERTLQHLFGSATPLSINIGEYYQHGARKVGGDSFEGGGFKAGGDVLQGDAQKGDRVEMHRSSSLGGGATASDAAPSGPKVTHRKVGPVRRCPICNLPTTDPERRYCTDCGAPLPSPSVEEEL